MVTLLFSQNKRQMHVPAPSSPPSASEQQTQNPPSTEGLLFSGLQAIESGPTTQVMTYASSYSMHTEPQKELAIASSAAHGVVTADSPLAEKTAIMVLLDRPASMTANTAYVSRSVGLAAESTVQMLTKPAETMQASGTASQLDKIPSHLRSSQPLQRQQPAVIIGSSLVVNFPHTLVRALSLKLGPSPLQINADGVLHPVCEMLVVEHCSGMKMCLGTKLREVVQGAFYRGMQRLENGTLLLVLSKSDSQKLTVNKFGVGCS